MGSYNGTEVCELVGIYILSFITYCTQKSKPKSMLAHERRYVRSHLDSLNTLIGNVESLKKENDDKNMRMEQMKVEYVEVLKKEKARKEKQIDALNLKSNQLRI